MKKKLYNSLPRNKFNRIYLMNGNGLDTNDGTKVNATVVNGTYTTSDIGYQKQKLDWGALTSFSYSTFSYTDSYIWIKSSGVWTFTKNSAKISATALTGTNGESYAGLFFTNAGLTESEEQALKQEGLRQLGAGSDGILSNAVAQFENYGDNNLENIIGGITASRTGGTATTDNFGISKAITNPNYTWSSITYTTGYTFEDDGTGWAIKTNPTGLSATGINRTTTLRNIFLMNKTLSADEVTELERLCKLKYLYPFKKTLPPNLKDGLVLEILGDNDGTTWYDNSGNGNNGTGTAITTTRKGQHKVMGFNGSNSYISSPTGPALGTGDRTYHIKFKTSVDQFVKALYSDRTGTNTFVMIVVNPAQIQFALSNSYPTNYKTITYNVVYNDNKWHDLICETDGNNINMYYDNQLVATTTWTPFSTDNTDEKTIGRYNGGNYFTGEIPFVRIYNRKLSSIEKQQIFYSTFIS